jgi:potassium efflux system protein
MIFCVRLLLLASVTFATFAVGSPPDARELAPSWWEYFDVEAAEMADRVASLIETLPQDEAVQDLVLRVKGNLVALQRLKGQSSPISELAPLAREEYDIEALLGVVRELRLAKVRHGQLDEDVSRLTDAIDSQKDKQVALATAYSAQAGDRLRKGLELIAGRAAQAVAEQQLRLLIGEQKVQQLGVLRWSTELEIARNRLVASADSSKVVETHIRSAEDVYEQSNRVLLEAEATKLASFAETPVGRVNDALLNQQSLHARIEAGQNRLILVGLLMTRDLQELLVDGAEGEISLLSERLSDWGELLEGVRVNVGEWRVQTDQEYRRASQAALAATDGVDPQSKEVEWLNRRRLELARESLTALQRLEKKTVEVAELREITEDELYRHQSSFGQTTLYLGRWIRDGWRGLWKRADAPIFWIGESPVTFTGLVQSIFILAAALWLSRLARTGIQTMADRQRRTVKPTFFLLSRLAYYAILIIGMVLTLSVLGLDFSNIALVAGALSVGIGFGLQTIVSNFVSGLIILFEGNIRVSDFLELESGMRGRVAAINVRSTILRTNDGIEVVVPNAEIIGTKVINWTMSDVYRRIRVPFSVAYGTNKDKVREVVLEAADRVPLTLKDKPGYAAPKVRLTSMADSALEFELLVWVDRRPSKHLQGTISEYLWEIHAALETAAIEIPYPQRDIHIRSGRDVTDTPPQV